MSSILPAALRKRLPYTRMHLPHYSTNRVLDPKPPYASHPTSCRVLAAITTVLGSASAGARGSSPFDLARGSVVCILGSCCADGEVSLARGSGRADVALERRLSPAEA
jgi:hypothetical protein